MVGFLVVWGRMLNDGRILYDAMIVDFGVCCVCENLVIKMCELFLLIYFIFDYVP